MNKFFQLLCVLALLFNFKIVFAACEKETTSYIETTRLVSDGVLQKTGTDVSRLKTINLF